MEMLAVQYVSVLLLAVQYSLYLCIIFYIGSFQTTKCYITWYAIAHTVPVHTLPDVFENVFLNSVLG